MMGQRIPSVRLQMTKNLEGVADTPDGCAAIQRDVNRLVKWVTGTS